MLSARFLGRPRAISIAAGILFLLGLASRWAPAADLDPELVGRWPGFSETPVAIVVEGAYAYCVFQYSGLGIFDISRPATPALAGSFRSSHAQDVFVQATYVYLLDLFEGMLILDVSDPRRPRRVGGDNPALALAQHRGVRVFVSGGHAYVVSVAGLYVADVSDPANPRLLSLVGDMGSLQDVFVAGDLAYVAAQPFGLHIFDVTDPARPQRLGGFATDLGTNNVFVSGNLAYVDDQTGIHVVDVSDPSSPKGVSKLPPLPFLGGRRPPSVFVSGNQAYCPGNGLVVYDMSDPALPRQLGSLDDVSAGPVHVAGGYAYLGGTHTSSGQVGLQVVDVSDPALPRRVGAAVTQSFARDVVVVGSHAYVVDPAGLLVFDVTDSQRPELVTTLAQPGAVAIAASSEHVYVAASEGGLVVFDIGSPRSPRLAGSYRTTGLINKVVVSGARAYVALRMEVDGFGLEILDISDRARPVRAGRYPAEEGPNGIELAVWGDRLYVTNWQDLDTDWQDLDIVDASDPARPVRLGGFGFTGPNGFAYVWGLAVAGDRAYVTTESGAFLTLDVSDPTQPRPLGEPVSLPEGGRRIWIDGGFALVASFALAGRTVLEIVDVSDPARPEQVARYATQSGVEGLFISGGHAYLAAGELLILDVTRRANPQRLGIDRSPLFANGVFVSGSHAYVANDDEGLLVLDVSDRRSPKPVGQYSGAPFRKGTTDSAVRVFVSGNHAYVTVNTYGLAVFDVSDPASPRLAGTVAWRRNVVDGIIVADGYAYVRDQPFFGNPAPGLQVIDVSSPDRPRLAGRYEGLLYRDFSIASGHAFVASERGLEVLDLSDPRNPRRVGSHPLPILSVQVSEGYAYATAESSGGAMLLEVFDVSRPDNPRRVGGYLPDSRFLDALAVSGNHAYLTSARSGLEVLDVSRPENPRRVGGNAADVIDARQLVVAEGAVFVANRGAGLLILDEFLDETGPPSFRRGDANGDGDTNLSDAVYTLSYLFRGGAEPDCLEAADGDDNGVVDLTDPVRLLNHLFRGGPAPEPPGPLDCGEDSVGSPRLRCKSYSKC